jgi:CheY-like chemotaxis protein
MDEKSSKHQPAPTGKVANRAPESPTSSKAKARVLVVDDDPVVLEVLAERLRSAGYGVHTRETSLGTSQWLADNAPDIIVLDINMPALSGGELAQVIRRTPSLRRTGVILHSSLSEQELDVIVGRTGALGAIPKTSDARAFMTTFDRLALKHRAHSLEKR